MKFKFVLVGAKHIKGLKPKYDLWGKPNWDRCDVLDVRQFTFMNAQADRDDPDSENTRFWEIMPEGTIELHVTDPHVWDMFSKLNTQFYVDIIPVENV